MEQPSCRVLSKLQYQQPRSQPIAMSMAQALANHSVSRPDISELQRQRAIGSGSKSKAAIPWTRRVYISSNTSASYIVDSLASQQATALAAQISAKYNINGSALSNMHCCGLRSQQFAVSTAQFLANYSVTSMVIESLRQRFSKLQCQRLISSGTVSTTCPMIVRGTSNTPVEI